ncbi:molecular chaperone [Trinickia sp. NRRL B-1857]|uniref:fimbrial biogenesis chaperone n=1 Tax=Trinickia sp. NRRL B-1857 TaxID=3162879 RepID=UPI003D2B1410
MGTRFVQCRIVLAAFAVSVVVVGSLPRASVAASLQVSPVVLELQPGETAAGLTLRNSGVQPLYGQVRVFRWDQADGDDSLEPTTELAASPPLVELGPQSTQLVRLIRLASSPIAIEQSYRILVDELPAPAEVPAHGVTIRLRYSVPVFIEPPGVPGEPKLLWHLIGSGERWVLRVDNRGTRRAQVAAAEFLDGAAQRFEVSKGLLGYVLAGRSRQWPITLPTAAELQGGVKARALVNSRSMEAAVDVQTTR